MMAAQGVEDVYASVSYSTLTLCHVFVTRDLFPGRHLCLSRLWDIGQVSLIHGPHVSSITWNLHDPAYHISKQHDAN